MTDGKEKGASIGSCYEGSCLTGEEDSAAGALGGGSHSGQCYPAELLLTPPYEFLTPSGWDTS